MENRIVLSNTGDDDDDHVASAFQMMSVIVSVCDMEFVARKYQIRLRWIRAPDVRTENGKKARKEHAKLVNRKCLTILVYSIDEAKLCVGDVYNIGNSLKEVLLRKAADDMPWAWEEDLQ